MCAHLACCQELVSKASINCKQAGWAARVSPDSSQQKSVLTGAGAGALDTEKLFFRWPSAAENMPPLLPADACTDAAVDPPLPMETLALPVAAVTEKGRAGEHRRLR